MFFFDRVLLVHSIFVGHISLVTCLTKADPLNIRFRIRSSILIHLFKARIDVNLFHALRSNCEFYCFPYLKTQLNRAVSGNHCSSFEIILQDN